MPPADPEPTSRLQDLAAEERPQEKMERRGAQSLTDAELLAMLLRSGTKGKNVLAVAEHVRQQAGSLTNLIRWSVDDYRRIKGIGKVRALQLQVVFEIARRIREESLNRPDHLGTPEQVFKLLGDELARLDVEKFIVLCLNRKNRLVRRAEITSGTATSSLVHPREVFREAIRASATAVVCVHNHPSGDPAPSSADIQVTRQLREAAKAVDIDLLDHVIIGSLRGDPAGRGYYSFREAGLL